MIKRKKLLIGLILLLCISLMTGCSKLLSFISSDAEGSKMSKKILVCLENDDSEGIESMLCDITKSSPDTDEEIVAALKFFDGKVT